MPMGPESLRCGVPFWQSRCAALYAERKLEEILAGRGFHLSS